MNNIAIITARGGSKRIPRKNIRMFCGKPIIEYSIEAALGSHCFDHVMVSTDDREIAEIAEKAGAEVPFLRSRENSGDYATTADVIREVLLEYQKRGVEFTCACILYPTAPFVTAEKLRNAMTLLREQNVDSVLPMVRFSFPPQRAFVCREGKLAFAEKQYAMARSQDLEPMYHDCGQFCCFQTEAFLQKNSLVTDNVLGIEYPESEVQDIDTIEDWTLAELKYSMMKERRDVLSN